LHGLSLYAEHASLFCTFVDIAKSKDILLLLHSQLSELLQERLSLKAQVYMHQLYCLEDVFLASLL